MSDREARPDDGVFELLSVRGCRGLLRRARTDLPPGGLADDRGASFDLAFDRSAPVQIDGERGPSGRSFRVEVRPGVLDVVRP